MGEKIVNIRARATYSKSSRGIRVGRNNLKLQGKSGVRKVMIPCIDFSLFVSWSDVNNRSKFSEIKTRSVSKVGIVPWREH